MTSSAIPVSSSSSAPSRGMNIFLWVLQVLAAAMFLLAGGMKLGGAQPMVATFAKIGIGQWFRYVTGGIEVFSAILLLIPRVVAIGAFLLVCTMVGAIITHVFVIGGNPAAAIFLLVVTATIAWRRGKTLLGR
jgi:putative oxidoreductase